MEALFSIGHKQLTVVTIGGINYMPTPKEMEKVRDWVEEHREGWKENISSMPNANLQFEIQVFPEGKTNSEYLLLVEADYMDTEFLETWQRLLSAANDPDENDFIIFVVDGVNVKRINKVFLPFI